MSEKPSISELFAAAVSAQSAEDYDRAQVYLNQVLAADPRHPDALNNLGLIAYRAHCYPEALDLIGRALAAAPGRTAFHNNLGVVLSIAGRHPEAIEAFRRAVSGAPASVSFRCNLANALKECAEFERALDEFRAAIALEPQYGEAHFGAALSLLALGRPDEAWPHHRWRVASSGLQVPVVAGTLYDGVRSAPAAALTPDLREQRLLILGEQGPGDQLFFLRFAPALTAHGARLSFFTDSGKLADLLARAGIVETVYSAPDMVPPADRAVLAGDLPYVAAGYGPATPAPLAFGPDATAALAARQRLEGAGPPPYLGVTWRAGNAPREGRPEALRKSVPVESLARATRGWRGTAVVLQRHPAAGEIETFAAASGLPVHDGSALNDDLVAMHALLAALDDYAGVSNTNMHLRAAAGRTARVLVAFPPEWRWLARGAASPWFPGFTLYRAHAAAGWQPALEELARDLSIRK